MAIGAANAAAVTLLRAEQTQGSATTLFGKIRAKIQAPGVELPGHPSQVQLTARLGPSSPVLAPATATVSVEDADGVVYQLPAQTLPADGQQHTLTAPVTPGATGASYPLRVTAITVTYTLPATRQRNPAVFSVDSVSGGLGTAQLPGSVLRGFAARVSSADLAAALQWPGVANGSEPPSLHAAGAAGRAQAVTFGTGYGLAANVILGLPPNPLAAQLTLTAVPPGAVFVMPGIATQSYLAANSVSVGSTVQAAINGANVGVDIVAAVPSFPTVFAGNSALIVDLASVQNFLTGRALDAAPVTQWWLATADHRLPPGLAAGLPGGSAVTSETTLANGLLNDPLSDVPQQALLGVAIGALLLASTGFCASIAAGVRQRRAENALLAALGLPSRAAAGQLCLEKFMLSLPSAAAGLALGAFLAELLVPAITLSATATTPEPPVLIEFGWLPTLGVALVLAVLPVLAAALVMVRRPDPAASLRAAEAA
jgi:hypothetical protein